MKTDSLLMQSGYRVVTPVVHNHISYAAHEQTGDKFFFAVRCKSEPTLRRVTGMWELGVDVPDYEKYCKAQEQNADSFIVFFELTEPQEIRFALLQSVGEGRRFTNETDFPEGIIFVRVVDTKLWEPGVSFQSYRKGHKEQTKLQGFTMCDQKDPMLRLRDLEKRRVHIFEQVLILLDQADVMQHEIDEIMGDHKEGEFLAAYVR